MFPGATLKEHCFPSAFRPWHRLEPSSVNGFRAFVPLFLALGALLTVFVVMVVMLTVLVVGILCRGVGERRRSGGCCWMCAGYKLKVKCFAAKMDQVQVQVHFTRRVLGKIFWHNIKLAFQTLDWNSHQSTHYFKWWKFQRCFFKQLHNTKC